MRKTGTGFTIPNLRTRASIRKQTKKPQKCGFDFWQGHLCNSRTNDIRELLLFGKDVKEFFGCPL